MGCCSAGLTEEEVGHQGIEDKLKKMDRSEEFQYKLLLLGAGESGKSTLLSHMKQIHGRPFTENELKLFKKHILKVFFKQKKKNEAIRAEVAAMTEQNEFGKVEYEKFRSLWMDEGIQRTLEYRHRYQLIDTVEYLFENMERFSQPDYIPTFADVLHCRKRSIGFHKERFVIQANGKNVAEILELYDVGGQRNERSKWMNLFDHCDAMVFVAALSEFNQTLFEDSTQNRMKESLSLFGHIINLDVFKNSHTILFLNKSDLFREKIKKFRLSDYFDNYNGKEASFEDGVEFIKRQFLSTCNDQEKLVYVHITCATDPKNRQFIAAWIYLIFFCFVLLSFLVFCSVSCSFVCFFSKVGSFCFDSIFLICGLISPLLFFFFPFWYNDQKKEENKKRIKNKSKTKTKRNIKKVLKSVW
ncbi:hypothetical protein RFI_00483 [Reticulomyxa filosa]|uniref:Uncharacterized protein n=1 Tax=Reticulomyxa filosa TaxID=46433 RepID=X6PDK7_RETFI|nr:hypothetical protein RFI_00483 [Reticulomyxa filosa]|eukprot:ETO36580.1 hypothetical protein RFI_00483 [Reticulomyxa filosa]